MPRQLPKSIKLVSAALLIGITLTLPNAKADSTRLPPGIYATTITASDVPPYFPPEVIEILVGEWRTEFTDGGTYIVTKDGEIVVVGRYNSNQSRLIMTDLQGVYACTDVPGVATGVYRWSLENNELVLVPVNDRCDGRPVVLTAHALHKL
ncbi:MAG TPA: hypothetical protein VKN18_25260 [Blastocatellia bacterium]|nr:hypothetical protein [Blastocatellia bacterium]